MHAYDYDAQRWIDGDAGTQLLRQQQQERLDLLLSDRGADYARFTGENLAAAITNARQALAELETAAQ